MMRAVDRLKAHFSDEVGDCDVGIKNAVIETPVVDREQRLVKGMVTTTQPDMDDEVVLAEFDTSYFPDSVKSVYLDHQYTVEGKVSAVGVCRAMSIRKNGAWAQTFVMDTALGEDILTAIEAGALGGMSIGFKVLEAGPPTEQEVMDFGVGVKSVVRRSKLLEYSFTSMPANPGAIIQLDALVSKGEIRRKSAVLMGLDTTPERKHHRTRPVREAVIRGDMRYVRGG